MNRDDSCSLLRYLQLLIGAVVHMLLHMLLHHGSYINTALLKSHSTSCSNITTGILTEIREVLALVLLRKQVCWDVTLCRWERLAQ
jgi:hypothetical protein